MASNLSDVVDRLQTINNESLQQGLSTKVSKTGDKINGGSLTLESDIDDISVNSIVSTDTSYIPPTTAHARAYRVTDGKGNILGDIRFRHETSGEVNTAIISRYVSEDGTKTEAKLYITPNRSGVVGSQLATFNGSELLTRSNGLPLSGGTMNQGIRVTFDGSDGITKMGRSNDNGFFIENFNAEEVIGSRIALRAASHSSRAGWFELDANDGVTKTVMAGRPDGTLTWGGNNVLTDSSANMTKIVKWGMPNYSAIISGIAASYTAPKNGIVSFNKDVGGNAGNVTVNGATVYLGGNDASNEGNVMLFVQKGDVVNLSGAGAVGTSCFIPLYHGG